MTIDKAIQSLEDEMEKQTALGHPEHVENLKQMSEWLKELKAYKEQSGDEELDFVPEHKKIPCTLIIGKPCDDAISRQAAIDAFERFIHELGIEDEPYNYGEMAMSAKNVPSVTPQPKIGHWIRHKENCCYNKCSICEYEHCKESNYCPNCGAKMQEVEK